MRNLPGLPEQTPLYLDARVEKNVITITAEQKGPANERVTVHSVSLRIYLNDTLANLDRPVKVVLNGQTVFEDKVVLRVATLARSTNGGIPA